MSLEIDLVSPFSCSKHCFEFKGYLFKDPKVYQIYVCVKCGSRHTRMVRYDIEHPLVAKSMLPTEDYLKRLKLGLGD